MGREGLTRLAMSKASALPTVLYSWGRKLSSLPSLIVFAVFSLWLVSEHETHMYVSLSQGSCHEQGALSAGTEEKHFS